jgi:membrane protease YdiL (CAAX protease family)
MLAAAFGATAIDLGLPQSWRQLRRDAKIGAIAFLAILLPVYGLQTILTVLLEPEQLHPLIEELETHYSPEMMVAAVAAVVFAAPLFEETTFRLIFLGWLERREDITLGWRKRVAGPEIGPLGALSPAEESPTDATESPPVIIEADPLPPVMGLLPGLPYGWAPVLVSGAVFAMAHLGHGVAPVSLFPLGVTLGYIYQRTHRITPSLVCHGLFNGFSILMLWLQLASSPGTSAQ